MKSKDPKKDGEPLPPDMAPGNLLSVFTELAHQGKPDNSVELTRATGGRAVGFLKKEALEDAIQAIAGSAPPVHRQLHAAARQTGRVSCHPHRSERPPELTARTRAGYWSMLGADYRQHNVRRRVPSRKTVFSAIRQRRLSLSGSPVFGFTSKRGKLLLEMSSRMRWPRWNTSDVGYISIVNS